MYCSFLHVQQLSFLSFCVYLLIVLFLLVLLVSTQFVPSRGLTKGFYVRHNCWALDGFKMGGLLYPSVMKSILFLGGIILSSHSFRAKTFCSYNASFTFFKMDPSWPWRVHDTSQIVGILLL